MSKVLTVYWAGDLFDFKHLTGNCLLARAVERLSCGRYAVRLPQDGECEVKNRTSQSIRDADFELLYNCDVIVANFDGHDLDSGTVVEFCFAKMLDMPAVLLRTDFRNSGDHTLADGEPWNLMCSHYPRTEVVYINSMERYHRSRNSRAVSGEYLENFYDSIAADVVKALDKVTAQPSWLKGSELFKQYQMAVKSIGGTLNRYWDEEKLQLLAQRKHQNGLYS